MSLKNKKIIVTGGRGFIGTNLVSKLQAEGVTVRVIDVKPVPEVGLEGVDHVVVDICDEPKLSEEKIIQEY